MSAKLSQISTSQLTLHGWLCELYVESVVKSSNAPATLTLIEVGAHKNREFLAVKMCKQGKMK